MRGLAVLVFGQEPSATWRPNFEPLGLYCYKNAKNPNDPASSRDHTGACGCENTQFRWTDGELYMMESHAHGCSVFPSYDKTAEGDCSYFRIRSMKNGRILANVSESLGHAFFSASRSEGIKNQR